MIDLFDEMTRMLEGEKIEISTACQPGIIHQDIMFVDTFFIERNNLIIVDYIDLLK